MDLIITKATQTQKLIYEFGERQQKKITINGAEIPMTPSNRDYLLLCLASGETVAQVVSWQGQMASLPLADVAGAIKARYTADFATLQGLLAQVQDAETVQDVYQVRWA